MGRMCNKTKPLVRLLGLCLLAALLSLTACGPPGGSDTRTPAAVVPTPEPVVTPEPQPPDDGIAEFDLEAIPDETPGDASPEPATTPL